MGAQSVARGVDALGARGRAQQLLLERGRHGLEETSSWCWVWGLLHTPRPLQCPRAVHQPAQQRAHTHTHTHLHRPRLHTPVQEVIRREHGWHAAKPRCRGVQQLKVVADALPGVSVWCVGGVHVCACMCVVAIMRVYLFVCACGLLSMCRMEPHAQSPWATIKAHKCLPRERRLLLATTIGTIPDDGATIPAAPTCRP